MQLFHWAVGDCVIVGVLLWGCCCGVLLWDVAAGVLLWGKLSRMVN